MHYLSLFLNVLTLSTKSVVLSHVTGDTCTIGYWLSVTEGKSVAYIPYRLHIRYQL